MNFGDNIDVEKYAESLASKEAVNLPVTINYVGWLVEDKLLIPGDFIEIDAPSYFLKFN